MHYNKKLVLFSHMSIENVSWQSSGNRINLSLPFAKVDKEKRMVSGFATLDNLDRHGDIVTADASQAAFDKFRGNLREMHQPIAVGKVLSFNTQDFVDTESGKTFKGVYVDAYISKGAQDTWEKILDGTLTGFSIGGNIIQSSMEPGDTEEDETRRIIKEYDLNELSVVDSPANPLANIFSIQKQDGKSIFKGMATEIELENIFWCKSDNIALSSAGDAKNCVICGNSMDNIGWVEKSDSDKQNSIQKVIDSHFKKDDAPGPAHGPNNIAMESPSTPINSDDTINMYPDQNKIGTTRKAKKKKIKKGGTEMANDPDETLEEVDEVSEIADTDDTVEKSVTVSEVQTEELDFTKMISDLKDFFGEALNKSIEAQSASNEKIEGKIEKSSDKLKKKISKMADDYSSLLEKNIALEAEITELKKSLDSTINKMNSYESDTAIRKSGDVENAPETKIQKNIWQGSFLGVRDL